jgi:endoglucanase
VAWYGFNFQWIFSWSLDRKPLPPDLRALDFMAEQGFNFVRLAADYRFWTRDFKYEEPDVSILSVIDSYLAACRERGIHLSFNMHRVPGYCINAPEIEKHNLWLDREAQDGFTYQWEWFARHFKGIPADQLSFDLVNEPPNIGQYGMTREIHAAIIGRVVTAVRAVDAQRTIVIDGLEGGNVAMPELADLDLVHSGRGYQPMTVSHQGANWWHGWEGHPAVYPGGDWMGRQWDRQALHAYFEPWRQVEARGARIHMGEFGCYNHTPNDVALRWLADLMSVWREAGWGWALWNFEGPFGIINHGRPGGHFEDLGGFRVDRDLLALLQP